MPLFGDPALRPKPVFRPPADWEYIRDLFIVGEGSTRALAKAHGVKLSTLQARCRREGWVQLRAERAETALDEVITTGQSDAFD